MKKYYFLIITKNVQKTSQKKLQNSINLNNSIETLTQFHFNVNLRMIINRMSTREYQGEEENIFSSYQT